MLGGRGVVEGFKVAVACLSCTTYNRSPRSVYNAEVLWSSHNLKKKINQFQPGSTPVSVHTLCGRELTVTHTVTMGKTQRQAKTKSEFGTASASSSSAEVSPKSSRKRSRRSSSSKSKKSHKRSKHEKTKTRRKNWWVFSDGIMNVFSQSLFVFWYTFCNCLACVYCFLPSIVAFSPYLQVQT